MAGAAATLFGLRGRWQGACKEAAGGHLDRFKDDWYNDCSRPTLRVYIISRVKREWCGQVRTRLVGPSGLPSNIIQLLQSVLIFPFFLFLPFRFPSAKTCPLTHTVPFQFDTEHRWRRHSPCWQEKSARAPLASSLRVSSLPLRQFRGPT